MTVEHFTFASVRTFLRLELSTDSFSNMFRQVILERCHIFGEVRQLVRKPRVGRIVVRIEKYPKIFELFFHGRLFHVDHFFSKLPPKIKIKTQDETRTCHVDFFV